MKVELKDKERIDDLQRNGYQIIQNPEKFCFGMDAVLLTGFANAREKDILLDLGTGTGIIPLLMEPKYHCSISPAWRSRRRAQIWRDAVWR
mgnify:CR=1 FL=1